MAPFDDGSRDILGGADGPVERVIVVGAGMAGSACANALAHAGVDVVVLEARDRTGGRTWTTDLQGVPVDLGASWIHQPLGNPMTRWADLVGVARSPGAFVLDAVGWDAASGRRIDDETFRRIQRLATDGFDAAVGHLASELGPDASVADAIDAFSRRALASDEERRWLRLLLRGIADSDGAAPAERTLLRQYPNNTLDYDGEYLGDLPTGGYSRLVEPLAQGLDVRAGDPVVSVRYAATGVRMETASGSRLEASHAVITVPLGVLKAATITFDPPLPSAHASAIERLGFGRFEKVVLRFHSALWAERDVPHALILSDRDASEAQVMMGLERYQAAPMVVVFAYGPAAGRIADVSEDAAIDYARRLVERVTGGSVPEPLAAVRSGWTSDPASLGAYANVPLGSSHADLDAIGQPVGGRLLFAGEATASSRVGFADGAFTSGVREAKRLLGVPEVEVAPLVPRER